MSDASPEFLKLLAHDLRWGLLKALTHSDHRVQELVEIANEPMNLVSYHLKKLRDEKIVTTRRSEADGRDVYYRLEVGTLREMYRNAGMALHPALADSRSVMPEQAARVLFICTHNSARSQMAEGLMRHLGGGHIQVSSAGSHPTALHPDAVRTMDALGIDIRGQQSKDMQAFVEQSFDYIVTVCDRAREICPAFPGGGIPLHWGFADPAAVGDVGERQRAFQQIAGQLTDRIEHFLMGLTA
jgi:protein-tyrosine-phosphatase/DNA-binding transcriptional ArsR family regulator